MISLTTSYIGFGELNNPLKRGALFIYTENIQRWKEIYDSYHRVITGILTANYIYFLYANILNKSTV